MTHELKITQHVPAPRSQVYAAWLTPEGMSRWWWVTIGDTTYAVDGREGGDYLVQSASAGIGVRGTFHTLREPELIECSWVWLDGKTAGPEESLRVDLVEQDGGTLVTLTHQVSAADGVESYRQGWQHVLANLSALPQDGQITVGAPPAKPTERPGSPTQSGGELQAAITLTQVVAATPHDAYAAWLEPERLASWWWPGMETTYGVDARLGGRFAIRSEQIRVGASGTFLELDADERIVMTWLWESPGGAAPDDLVTVTFSDEGDSGGTLVTLVHEFAVPQEDTTNPTQGWSAVLTSLAERSAG